jgi:hypothetical protein
MPRSLETLEQQRAKIVELIVQLEDFRCGSITSTKGRCGKLNCRCHQPNQPGHGPNLRLTFKVEGKTVTESLPNPAAVNKAQREIAEFRKFQQLSRELVDVNAQICHLRPAEEKPQTPQEKKRRTPSSRKSHAK